MPEGQNPSSLDQTQPVGPPDSGERTSAIPPQPTGSPAPSDAAPTQQEIDRRLAQELTRRGVPPDEIQRLVSLGRGDPAPSAARQKPVSPSPPAIPPSEAFTPHPTIALPEFRDASTQQRIDADRLLTSANISRRRGNYRQAEQDCRSAIDLAPKDAAALELYGDILQSLGRVDDAVFAYHRAVEADAKRRTAERKYAELTLLQNREIDILREEYIPRNANVAVLFSAVLPGSGQLYNGDTFKGVFTMLLAVVCIVLVLWTPYGIPHRHAGVPASLVILLLFMSAIYLYAVVDANLSARRGRRPKSGWEV